MKEMYEKQELKQLLELPARNYKDRIFRMLFKEKNRALELKVLVLNINAGCNEELKARCKTLSEYMLFVDAVRNHTKNMPFPEAMETAIDECIRNGILADFLRGNKSEVQRVGIFEYDEQKYLEMERRDAEERGKAQGEKLGEERLGRLLTALFQSGKLEEAQRAAADKEFRNQLYKEYGIL